MPFCFASNELNKNVMFMVTGQSKEYKNSTCINYTYLLNKWQCRFFNVSHYLTVKLFQPQSNCISITVIGIF